MRVWEDRVRSRHLMDTFLVLWRTLPSKRGDVGCYLKDETERLRVKLLLC